MKSAACQQYLEERCSSSKGQAQVIDISEKQAAYPPKIGSLLHSHTQDEYPADGGEDQSRSEPNPCSSDFFE